MENFLKKMVRVAATLLLLLPFSFGAERKIPREEARFDIYVGGQEIGQEKFSIDGKGDAITSRSTVSFRDPGNTKQNIKMDTALTMDSHYVPRGYQLQTDSNGQKGMLKGTFVQGQAMFEYLAGGSTRKTGLLVGDHYVILDTNVFHHFIFVARLFDLASKEKSQSIEVLIPQEFQNGLLKVTDLGPEKLSVRGKTKELHHLKADTGSVQIDLWMDDHKVLYKIALPAKRLEVIRG
jgi:hypothetical protein